MNFADIYDQMVSEATYYEPKYIGQTLKVKDKVPAKIKQIAGLELTFMEKPKSTKGFIEIVGGSAHGETSYAKGSDGNYYILFNVPTAPFSVAKMGGKKVKLGAKGTAVQESAVCHFLALALKKKFARPEDVFDYITDNEAEDISSDLSKLQAKFETTNAVEDSASLVKEDKTWAKSISATVIRLMKEFKFKSSAVFHRGSTLSDTIDSKGLELANKAGAGFGTKKDKWNPSDIWVINKGSSDAKKIINSTSIQELNSIIDSNLDRGSYKQLFGISLKKSGYPKAVLKYMNMDNNDAKEISADEIATGKTPSKGITKVTDLIDTDDGIKMALRSSAGNNIRTISGIIAGKKAQHGSVTITDLFKYNKQTMPDINKDPTYYFTASGNATQQFYDEFQTLINSVIANAKRIKIKKTTGFIFGIKNKKQLDKFMKNTLESHSGNPKFATATIHSKLQGLYLAAIMTKDTFEKAYYAASAQGAFNPSFVKVGE